MKRARSLMEAFEDADPSLKGLERLMAADRQQQAAGRLAARRLEAAAGAAPSRAPAEHDSLAKLRRALERGAAVGMAPPTAAPAPKAKRPILPCLADSFIATADRRVADLRAATGKVTLSLRDAVAAAEQTGLTQAVSQMAPHEYAAAAREAIALRQLDAKRRSALRTYEAYYRGHGVAAPLPIKVDDAIAYIGHCVEVKGNASHAAGHTLSNLRTAASAIGQWSVTEAGERLLAAHIYGLQQAMPSKPKHGEAADALEVARACKRMRLDGTLQSLQTRAQTSLSAGLFMRGIELAHDSSEMHTGLRMGDLVPHVDGLGLQATLSKTGKLHLRPTNRACPHLPEPLAELCPSRCYSDYLAALAKAGRTLHEGDYLWPVIVEGPRGPIVTDRPMLSRVAQNNIMTQLRRVGADTSKLDAHWGRHTGSAMHRAYVGTTEDTSELLGGWSDLPAAQRRRRRTKAVCYAGNKGGPPIIALLDMGKKDIRKKHRAVCCKASVGTGQY
jgi:hypothetical protein